MQLCCRAAALMLTAKVSPVDKALVLDIPVLRRQVVRVEAGRVTGDLGDVAHQGQQQAYLMAPLNNLWISAAEVALGQVPLPIMSARQAGGGVHSMARAR